MFTSNRSVERLLKEAFAHGTERRKTKREGMMVAILAVLAGGGRKVYSSHASARVATCCRKSNSRC